MHRQEARLDCVISGVGDVIAAVNFARDNGVLAAVRGGGHNVGGGALCDGGIVIDADLSGPRRRKVLRFYRSFIESAPEELTI